MARRPGQGLLELLRFLQRILAQPPGMVERHACTASRALLCAALLAAPLASAFSVMPGAPGLRAAPGRAGGGRAGRGLRVVVAQTRVPGDGSVEKAQKRGNLWENAPAPVLQSSGTRPDITKLSADVKEVYKSL